MKKKVAKKQKQPYVTITISYAEGLFIACALDCILHVWREPQFNFNKKEIKLGEAFRKQFFKKVRLGKKTYA